jgi:hypothetical protein
MINDEFIIHHSSLDASLFAILTIFLYKYELIYLRYEIDCKNSKIIYLKKNYNKKTLKRYVFFNFFKNGDSIAPLIQKPLL